VAELKKSDKLYLNPKIQILPEILGNGNDIDYDGVFGVYDIQKNKDGTLTVKLMEL